MTRQLVTLQRSVAEGTVSPPPPTPVAPPVMLGLGQEEVVALRRAVEVYLVSDVGSDRVILEELYGLFVSWEQKGRG